MDARVRIAPRFVRGGLWRSDLLRWVLFMVLALALVGALRLRRDAAAGAPSQQLRIGMLPNVTQAPLLVAAEEGRLAEALGPRVRVAAKVFSAGTDLVTALAAGELDAACLGPGPALVAESAGIGLVPLAGAAYGGSRLLRGRGSVLRRAADLHGRRVTVPKYGNTQDVLLRSLLLERGLQDRARGGTVEILQADGPDAVSMLRQGQVDAAMLPEPWASRAILDAGAEVLLGADAVSRERYPSALLVASAAYAGRYPERVRGLAMVHRAVLSELRADPAAARERTGAALARHLGRKLREAVIRQAMEQVDLDHGLDAESLRGFAARMRRLGYLRRPLELDWWLRQGEPFGPGTPGAVRLLGPSY